MDDVMLCLYTWMEGGRAEVATEIVDDRKEIGESSESTAATLMLNNVFGDKSVSVHSSLCPTSFERDEGGKELLGHLSAGVMGVDSLVVHDVSPNGGGGG